MRIKEMEGLLSITWNFYKKWKKDKTKKSLVFIQVHDITPYSFVQNILVSKTNHYKQYNRIYKKFYGKIKDDHKR